MNIIIKGMEKPKDCGKCPISVREKICGGATTDCPIIEIVECKDCKYSSEYEGIDPQKELSCDQNLHSVSPTDFCSGGERRNDEID